MCQYPQVIYWVIKNPGSPGFWSAEGAGLRIDYSSAYRTIDGNQGCRAACRACFLPRAKAPYRINEAWNNEAQPENKLDRKVSASLGCRNAARSAGRTYMRSLRARSTVGANQPANGLEEKHDDAADDCKRYDECP